MFPGDMLWLALLRPLALRSEMALLPRLALDRLVLQAPAVVPVSWLVWHCMGAPPALAFEGPRTSDTHTVTASPEMRMRKHVHYCS